MQEIGRLGHSTNAVIAQPTMPRHSVSRNTNHLLWQWCCRLPLTSLLQLNMHTHVYNVHTTIATGLSMETTLALVLPATLRRTPTTLWMMRRR